MLADGRVTGVVVEVVDGRRQLQLALHISVRLPRRRGEDRNLAQGQRVLVGRNRDEDSRATQHASLGRRPLLSRRFPRYATAKHSKDLHSLALRREQLASRKLGVTRLSTNGMSFYSPAAEHHRSTFAGRSTQSCISSSSLNRVPASAGVKAGMSPLPGGR